MSTARFCDICGKEAPEACGEMFSEDDKTRVGAALLFSDDDGSMASVCPSCADDLIIKLLSEQKRKEFGL